MNCRAFQEQASELGFSSTLDSADEQSLAHLRECSACANWWQQRQALSSGLQALRAHTATLQASVVAEREVLRAFRQGRDYGAETEGGPAEWLPFPALGGWRWPVFAAAAAALAIALGIGAWFWQHSSGTTPSVARQPAVRQPAGDPQSLAVPREEATKSDTALSGNTPAPQAAVRVPSQEREGAATSSSSQPLAQLSQSQGYVPLMLCDPLSCSGDEQVVRMEIPASSADGSNNSSESQLADVVVGEDGLVRAIRIVQQ
jgi:hypothetical protein